MGIPVTDKIWSFANFFYDAGPFYNTGDVTGGVDITHYNDDPITVSSEGNIRICIYNQSDILVRTSDISFNGVILDPAESFIFEGQAWSVSLAGLPAGTYYVIIQKLSEPSLNIGSSGNTFVISPTESSAKAITEFFFYKYDGNNADYWPVGYPVSIIGSIDPDTREITFNYPNGMSVTDLTPRIYVSPLATVDPASLVSRDFSSQVSYRVTAEDATYVDYTVDGTEMAQGAGPSLFIYDNIYTRAIPGTLERGDTLNWFCLIANSGAVANSGSEELTVSITDDDSQYYDQIYQGAVGVVNPFEDKELSGSYVIENDIPLGSSIKYFIQFHLNNSLIKRYVIVSAWEESSRGIVFNKPVGAFVRQTFSKSKFFTNINNDFYTLGIAEGSNFFYWHNDEIADGQIRLYDQPFNPAIEFVVNKSNAEKVFDNIILHMDNIGVLKIEYWTETQYAIHEWPDNPLNTSQVRPWIDPEFREDKWYFPIHNEEISDYDYIADQAQPDSNTVVVKNTIPLSLRDSGTIIVKGTEFEYVNVDRNTRTFTLSQTRGFALVDGDSVIGNLGDLSNTREMRGTWLKIKITFKAYYKFALKSVFTEFRESNI